MRAIRLCLAMGQIVGLALGLAITAALAGFAKTALAGAFSVVPQMVELSAERRSGMVEVRNNAEVETVFQVETFAWTDSIDLADLTPTRDVLAVPAVFRLAPGATQTVRIAARGSPGPVAIEQSYRLLISEVPNETQAGGVVFALRMSLPVFLTPAGARGNLQFQLAADGRQLRLSNSGSAHLRLREVRLVEAGSGQVREILPLDQPAYLLAGRSRSLPLTVHARGRGLRFEAETTSGPFQHILGD